MNKTLVSILALLAAATTATADSLKGGYSVCISEQLYDEYMAAIMAQDEQTIASLLTHGCAVTSGGIPVTVLATAQTGRAKIKVHTGGSDSVVVWTHTANILR